MTAQAAEQALLIMLFVADDSTNHAWYRPKISRRRQRSVFRSPPLMCLKARGMIEVVLKHGQEC